MEENKQEQLSQISQQFCLMSLNDLLDAAYDIDIRVVGAVKEIFKHKRFIVQLSIKDKVVIRCLKRYNQFQALKQVLMMNFKNIDLRLVEFPSKFQVVNRQQTRRKYFEDLLNKLVNFYLQKITNQTNRRLFSTLYVFLSNGVKKKQIPDIKLKKSSTDPEPTFKIQKIQQHIERARKMSDSFGSLSGGSADGQEYESVYQEIEEAKLKNVTSLKIDEKKKSTNEVTGSISKIQESLRKRVFNEADLATMEGKKREFMATEFEIRFQDDQEWKERYFKIEQSCLLIYKHKNENNFKTKIELFQAKIDFLVRNKNFLDHFCEKMEIDNEPIFLQNQSILAISHPHDYQRFLIRLKPEQRLDLPQIKNILLEASHARQSTDIEGVFSPIGKIFIILHKLHFVAGNPKTLPIVFLRIKTSGFRYETKRVTYSFDIPLSIKQGFMIPISNSFASIAIEVIAIENDGILRHQSEQKLIGQYRLSFADFISHPSGQGLEKLKVKFEQNQSNNFYQGYLQVSAINYSHFSSIYADSYANENDGLIMTGLKSTSDTDELVITVDRVLQVIGNLALFITAFWRNVYLFKYPRMSYAFFMYLIILFNFGTSFLYIRLFVFNLVIAMLYQLPNSRKLIQNVLDVYFFKFRHPAFIKPLCLSSSELKFRKWSAGLSNLKRDYRLLQNGKLEKKPQIKERKYEEWIFTVHGKVFRVREELPSLIEKVFEVKKIVELVLRMISAVINTLEKIFNIICWADPKRSAIIFGILLFIVTVAQPWIFQLIGTIFCIHRIVKGLNFYEKKHYASNRKLATFSLRYIMNLDFSVMIPGKEKKITTTNQEEIETLFKMIIFPFRDEEKYKKLKNQIEHILGVYLDFEELESREKKNGIPLIQIVNIIQSCESRLKLEWVSGQEGSSDEFQELKKLTDEDMVIDLWVESLLINFFLNIPSQLYTTFRPLCSDIALKNEQDKVPFKKITV